MSQSSQQLIVELKFCELGSGFMRDILFLLTGTIIDIRNCNIEIAISKIRIKVIADAAKPFR